MGRSTSAARPHLPVDEGPGPGDLLDVALRRAGVPLTSRVLEVEPDRLVLSPPADVLGAPSRLVAGEEVDLVWTDSGDLVGVAVAVASTGGEGWTARVVGPPQRVQRRDAVRVPVDGRAVVHAPRRPAPAARLGRGPVPAPASGEAADAAADGLEVALADLSEGGARCLVDPVVLPLEQGQTVLLQLPVAGLSGPVRARVVHRRFRAGGRHVHVGLRFVGLGEVDADVLRRHVFTRMRELRRRGDL